MTQEDKELLLRDICARLPYGVKVHLDEKHIDEYPYTGTYVDSIIPLTLSGDSMNLLEHIEKYGVKPYLRPMSSMTEEEREVCIEEYYKDWKCETIKEGNTHDTGCTTLAFYSHIDWLNAHHFDYRGLIPKGLALEAPKDMYKTE